MRLIRSLPLLIAVAASFTAGALSFQDSAKKAKQKEAAVDESSFDEKILRDAQLAEDGPALLQYFRDRTPKEVEPKVLAQLIEKLGDEKFSVREKAHKELLILGTAALAAVKDALKHPDQEVRLRAGELCLRIEEQLDPRVQAAVARLVGQRRPPGAAEVLLGYLAFVVDETVAEEICRALSKVAAVSGKPEAVVVAALADKLAVKRGAAGAALVTVGAKDHMTRVRELLNDPDATVRIKVASAYVEAARDKDAIPVLIQCLKVLQFDKTRQAGELLDRIAGDTAPRVSLGTDQASCQACFDAWDKWWQENQQGLDLAKVDFSNGVLGYSLVVFQKKPVAGVVNPVTFCVAELDAAGKTRWQFEVPGICEAQVVGQGRVLVAERTAKRITERDFEGKVVWEIKNVPVNLLSVQRLRNGNTFAVFRNQVIEYSPKGEEVFSFSSQQPLIYRGLKLRDGNVVLISSSGEVSWVDAKTKNEVKKFNVGTLGSLYGTLEELPNGNLLLPLYRLKKVVELDRNGKEVWSLQTGDFPSSATRLPNGNTFVSFLSGARIAEYDRNYREVWSHQTEGPVLSAHKR